MSRGYRFAAVAVAGLFGVVSITSSGAAQTTAIASVNAVAHVSGIAPLTAAGVNDLNFGAVTAGTPKAPTSLASDAARFNLSGEVSTPVTVSYTLPTVLTGAGATTIPITFGATDGLLWTSYPATHTTFNPNAPFFTNLGGSGNMIVGLAGTVSPPLGTTTGNYTGTITMTVSY
jgi:hypothetical protein